MLLKFLSDLVCNFYIFGLFLAIIGPFGTFRTSMGPQTNHMWVLLALPNDARRAQYTSGGGSGLWGPTTPKIWQPVANIHMKMMFFRSEKHFYRVKMVQF